MVERITVTIIVTSLFALFGISHIIYSGRIREDESAGRKDEVKIYRPYISHMALFSKLHLFYASLKRFVYDNPDRDIDEAVALQESRLAKFDWTTKKVKRIYFIRHGESVWNMTFEGSRGFFSSLVSALKLVLAELALIICNDSLYYDSPLSTLGISQAVKLGRFIFDSNNESKEEAQILAGTSQQKTTLFTSNLRRAQTTLMLAIRERLSKSKEVIHVLSELEETVSNLDCVSMSSTLGYGVVPLLESMALPDLTKLYPVWLKNLGGGSPSSSSAYERMTRFNERIFADDVSEVVIVCGHSRWLRRYITIFFTSTGSQYEYKTKKIGNTDVIRFDVALKQNPDSEEIYEIEKDSLKHVYSRRVKK